MSIKKHLAAIIVAPLAIASAVFGADDDIELSDKEQAAYEKALDGRTAGKPKQCISRAEQRNMTVISDDILIFGSSRNGKTLYVNKPHLGCNGAKHNVLTFIRPDTPLCSGQVVRVDDAISNTPVGSCALGEFIPYVKE